MEMSVDAWDRADRVDLLLWSLTAASIGLTLWLSLWSAPPGMNAFAQADKVQHFAAYLVTSTLLYLAGIWRPGREGGPLFRWRWWILAVIVAAGGVLELLQSGSGRDVELGDWLAEVAAVMLAFSFLASWARRSRGPDSRRLPSG